MASERDKLVEQSFNARSDAQRKAIEKRIAAIDKATADSAGEESMDALSWAQRKTKEFWSGDENEWYSPEGMPTWAYAAGNTALDLVADPLNFIPMGLLGKAAKAVPSGKLKGNLLSSAPNYIKNHYGLTDGPKTAQGLEKAAVAALPNSMLPEEKLGAVRGVKGKIEWLAEAAKNAATATLTPSGRALYADTGINKGLQSTVKKHLDNVSDPKGQAKAGANINYNLHENVQQAWEGTPHPVMAEVGKMSNLETYRPNTAGSVSEMLTKHSGTVKGTRKNAVSKADELPSGDAAYIEDHMGVWGPTDDVVMKRPQSGTGGNHYNDLYFKSPLTSAVFRAFNQHGWKPTQRQLYDSIKAIEKAQPAGKKNTFRIKNKDYTDVEENGLWLTGSLPGTAITEGGVNWLSKVDTSGKMTGVISDKHDFLDKMSGVVARSLNKIPGMKVSPDITERSLLAVTPPMKGTIQSFRKTQYGKTGGKPTPTYSGIPAPVRGSQEATQRGILEQYTQVQPTAKTLQNENVRQAGMLSVPLALHQPNNTEEPTP
jgi:hypothetical protein